MTDEELEAAMDAVEAGTLHEPSGLLLALVAEVRRLRAYSASGTEHRGKAADALEHASGGHFTRGLNRHEVEEVVAIVDNTLLQERRKAS